MYDRRYNAWGQLARIERQGQAIWTANMEDAAGGITSSALGNGLSIAQNYNGYTGRLADGTTNSAQSTLLLQEGYQYDALGNVLQRLQQWGGTSFTENFHYDKLNRLSDATIVGYPQQVFTYDDIGNITTKTGVGSGSYVYPSSGANSTLPHAVSSIGGIAGSFLYDKDGNLTSGAGRTVSWNSFDMPVTISKGTSNSTFYYGPDHQRVKQVRSDGVTLWYAGAMEVEASSAGAVVKTYLPNGLGVEIDKNATTQVYYTHHDRLGSVVAISDQTGALVETMAYDSWGKRREQATPNTPDSIDGVKDNKGFTDQEMLDQLDLVHMNGRVYDPFVGRFISADPIIQNPEHSQSYNRYSYVWNNPTNLTDPTGFETLCTDEQGCPTPTQPTGEPTPRPANSVIPPEQDSRTREGQPNNGKETGAVPPPSASSGSPESKAQLTVRDPEERKHRIEFMRQGGGGMEGAASAEAAYQDWAVGKGYISRQEQVDGINARGVGAVIGTVAAAGAIAATPAAAEAGAVIPMRVGQNLFTTTVHSVERMAQRGIPLTTVEQTLAKSVPTPYFHEGIWKLGFWNAEARVLVATVAGRITTVMKSGEKYVSKLFGGTP